MISIYDLNFDQLAEYFKSKGEPSYRAEQVFKSLHNGVDVQDIPNIPKPLRELIATDFYAKLPSIEKKLVSKDGTVKYLLKIDEEDTLIECVFLQADYGNTVCVSSQVGCKMGCAFCASGKNGFVRNLTAGEILSQVILLNKLHKGIGVADGGTRIVGDNSGKNYVEGSKTSANEKSSKTFFDKKNEERAVSNIVIMGSGEPFDNFDNTVNFLKNVTDKRGINISARNISVSTSGLPDKIRAFADLGLQVNLCISLHASNDEIRVKIMPVAKVHPIKELIDAAKYFFNKTRRRVIFEYAMIKDVNIESEHAKQLAMLLRGFPAHVNLINLNSVQGSALQPPTFENAKKFMDAIIKTGLSCTMRKSKGEDIASACGQLRIKFVGDSGINKT